MEVQTLDSSLRNQINTELLSNLVEEADDFNIK